MAFKLNFLMLNPVSRGGTANCTLCGNWISLPDITLFAGQDVYSICAAYPDFASVAQPGSCTGIGILTVCDFTRIDALTTRNCTVARNLAVLPPIQTQQPIRVILRVTTIGDRQAEFVGTDAPGRKILIRNSTAYGGSATCTLCGNWVNLPYHTTGRRLFDICLENPNFGSVAATGSCSGLGNGTVCIQTSPDSLTTRNCAVAAGLAVNPFIVVGQPVRIILKPTTTGDVLWSPSHF